MARSSKTKPGKGAPISTHPAFPAIVALWFAALFGLGSFALPIALFEKLTSATGIASVVSAAAPPLGVTARIVIALFSAGIGVVLGLWLSRKVVSTHKADSARDRRLASAVSTRDQAPAVKKPILAHAELGEDGLDGDIDDDHPNRRRSLSVTDDSGPSDYFAESTLPGGSAFELMDEIRERDGIEPHAPAAEAAEIADVEEEDIGALELTSFVDRAHEGAENGEPETGEEPPFSAPVEEFSGKTGMPGERADFAPAHSGPAPVDDAPFAPPQEVETDPSTKDEAGTYTETPPFSVPEKQDIVQGSDPMDDIFTQPLAASFGEQANTGEILPASGSVGETGANEAAPDEGKSDSANNLDELSIAQLVARFADAMQDQSDREENGSLGESEVGEEPNFETGDGLAFEAEEVSQPEVPTPFAEPAAVAQVKPNPVPAFDIPQSAAMPQAANTVVPGVSFSMPEPAAAKAQDVAPAGLDAPQAEDNFSQETMPESDVPPIPAALRPAFAEDDEQDDVESADETPIAFSLPIGAQAAAPTAFDPAVAGADPDEIDEGEAAYSSLLNMKTRLIDERDSVRIDDSEIEDEEGDAVEPVVIFPGQEQRRATPAVDGPSRSPANSTGEPIGAPFGAPAGQGNVPQGNPGETEQALRDALEKLQRLGRTG